MYSNEVRMVIDELKLNMSLLAKNRVPEENIHKMKDEYKRLKDLFNKAHKNYDEVEKIGEWRETEIKVASQLGMELEQIEASLQRLWNFKENDAFYTYWLHLPGCLCPKLDNQESYGFRRIINCSCPYHQNLCKRGNDFLMG